MSQLLEAIKSRALKTGLDVTLASGQKSSFYVDMKQVSLQASTLKWIAQEFWALLEGSDSQVDALAGVSLGGDPLVSAVMLEALSGQRDLAAFLIRKESKAHGTSQGGRIEGPRHLKDKLQSLWLLEDVVSSGQSSLSAAKHLLEAGYPLKGIACILDREMGGVESLAQSLSIPVLSLYRRSDLGIE